MFDRIIIGTKILSKEKFFMCCQKIIAISIVITKTHLPTDIQPIVLDYCRWWEYVPLIYLNKPK